MFLTDMLKGISFPSMIDLIVLFLRSIWISFESVFSGQNPVRITPFSCFRHILSMIFLEIPDCRLNGEERTTQGLLSSISSYFVMLFGAYCKLKGLI